MERLVRKTQSTYIHTYTARVKWQKSDYLKEINEIIDQMPKEKKRDNRSDVKIPDLAMLLKGTQLWILNGCTSFKPQAALPLNHRKQTCSLSKRHGDTVNPTWNSCHIRTTITHYRKCQL